MNDWNPYDSASSVANSGAIIGHVVAVDWQGRATVEYPGCGSPRPARALSGVDVRELEPNAEVLLVLAGTEVIVTGVLAPAPSGSEPEVGAEFEATPEEVVVDGQRVRLEAKQEISLVCGKSSIVLRRDGKIVVKGVEIVSRAQGRNKIKGGSVHIN